MVEGSLLAIIIMVIVSFISKKLADRDTERFTRECEERSKKYIEMWRR